MSQTTSTKCYIEEYKNENDQLSARLREKRTGRKVDLGLTLDGKQHFLRLLSAAGANKTAMPDVFSRDGDEECVVVSGGLDFDAKPGCQCPAAGGHPTGSLDADPREIWNTNPTASRVEPKPIESGPHDPTVTQASEPAAPATPPPLPAPPAGWYRKGTPSVLGTGTVLAGRVRPGRSSPCRCSSGPSPLRQRWRRAVNEGDQLVQARTFLANAVTG